MCVELYCRSTVRLVFRVYLYRSMLSTLYTRSPFLFTVGLFHCSQCFFRLLYLLLFGCCIPVTSY